VASNILVRMLGDSTHLERSFKRANAAAAGFNKSQTKTNKASKANQKVMRGVGSSVRLAGGAFLGGAGIVAGITSTLSKTAEFEKSLNTFQAVSKATSVQMKAIGAQAQQLGGDILLPGTSAKDAAEAMLELSKSGLSVTQVQKAVRSTLLLSAAAGVENARAAEIASNTLNAFNLDASKTPRVVDVLASAANASSIEIDDAALSFQQAGAIFSTFQGRTLGAEGAMKELAISVGLLGNAGIKGSDAGTSLKTALQRLASPVAKTKNLMRDLHLVTGGNEEAQRLFQLSIEGSSKKVRDLASNQLEKLQGSTKSGGDIAYDAAGRMRPFNEIIKNIAAATKGMTEEQKNWIVTQLGGSDASRALLILMRKQGTAYDTMSRAVNRSGSAADIAKAKQKGLAGAMDALKSAIETVQITLGTALAPALTKYLQSAARWVSDTNNQKTLMDSLRTTMASVGAVLRVIAAIFRGLSTVLGGNKNAVIFLIGAFVAFKALNMAATIAGMARNFGLLTAKTNAQTAATTKAAVANKTFSLSMVGKAGLVGAVGLAAFGITTMILKLTGLDKKLKGVGATAFDVAAKLGLVNDPTAKFAGKRNIGQAEAKRLRATAGRLQQQGLSPNASAAQLIRQHPNLAAQDLRVLAGATTGRGVPVNVVVQLDRETIARVTTEAQNKAKKRNTTQRRGRISGR
jgi:TP901 family phage tail tape measure protein